MPMTPHSAESPALTVVTDGVQVQVTSALRHAIVSGQLQPGEALSEAVLARRYGVSRTPVREALKQLEREHLVQIVPRVGTYVQNASADDVLDGLVVKEALEGIAARLAAGRPDAPEVSELSRLASEMEAAAAAGADLAHIVEANLRFHGLILRLAASPALQFHLQLLLNQFRVPHQRQVAVTLSRPARLRQMLAEHRRIVTAIEAGDPAEAERAMRAHVSAGREEIRKVFRTQPGPIDPGGPA
jgi:DNA-binding GntR family transcriptional regulator